MNSIVMSAIIVTLFLGGPAGPVPFGPGWLWGLIWFFAKLMVFLFTLVWIRATLPRFRYDQLMNLGLEGPDPGCRSAGCCCWAPSTSAATRTGTSGSSASPGRSVLLVGYLVLNAALRVAARRRAEEEVFA